MKFCGRVGLALKWAMGFTFPNNIRRAVEERAFFLKGEKMPEKVVNRRIKEVCDSLANRDGGFNSRLARIDEIVFLIFKKKAILSGNENAEIDTSHFISHTHPNFS